ncbi:MAG: glycosyl transferase family 1 [Sphingopyxis sp.]|nr:glycosyl transferase family 1 [Sphingopyxis sp.]
MIRQPYTLVLNVELYRHDGQFWAEPLWHKDLFLHLTTIEQLSLVCPVRDALPPSGWIACDTLKLTIVSVPPLGRLSWLRIPEIAWIIRRAIRPAEIVHIGVAGWPFPLGWIAMPLARRAQKFLVIVIESSFWRVDESKASFLKILKSRIYEKLNVACVNACDICFFTSETYRQELGHEATGSLHVLPASWLDERQLIAPEDISGKFKNGSEFRLLFAGRLTEAKGILVLLNAIEMSSVTIDIIGEGEFGTRCREIAARFPNRVRVLDPVPYGDQFSALLDGYHAIIVPTLSDEQPRILLDAFSRGLPAIASDRSGNLDFVRPGETGWLVHAGDAAALADAMDKVARNPVECEAMGQTARQYIRHQTHEAMHRERAEKILSAMPTRGC